MTVPTAFGLFFVALGLASVLVAWLHPAPHQTLLVKALAWPRKAQDRIGISLASVMFMAIGAMFAVDVPGVGWIPTAVCGIVVLATALAIGLREPAV